MNQIEIGKFIAECRKRNNLTQMQLAEVLNITDRAVSKWENGKAMPDSSIMLKLCSELKISVNELLSGEKIEMDNYNEKAEQNLLEIRSQKEETDKKLLTMEIVIGVMSVLLLVALVLVTSRAEMADLLVIRRLIIIIGIIPVIVILLFTIMIEQVAGYYECQKCHHKHVPTYFSTLFSMHINRTRYMKCPKCNRKSWQRKVISK